MFSIIKQKNMLLSSFEAAFKLGYAVRRVSALLKTPLYKSYLESDPALRMALFISAVQSEFAGVTDESKNQQKIEEKRSDVKRKVLGKLIAFMDDINEQDENGYTWLHMASRYGCLEAVEVLLKSEADPWIEDRSGSYPIQSLQFDRLVDALIAERIFNLLNEKMDNFYENPWANPELNQENLGPCVALCDELADKINVLTTYCARVYNYPELLRYHSPSPANEVNVRYAESVSPYFRLIEIRGNLMTAKTKQSIVDMVEKIKRDCDELLEHIECSRAVEGKNFSDAAVTHLQSMVKLTKQIKQELDPQPNEPPTKRRKLNDATRPLRQLGYMALTTECQDQADPKYDQCQASTYGFGLDYSQLDLKN